MERWLPVVGYEAEYKVSDWGHVESLDRVVVVNGKNGPFERHYSGKRLSSCSGGEGNHQIVVLSRGGNYERKLVHHLVLEAFAEPRPSGLFGLHRDDDVMNNHLSNLYWGTKSQNQDDKVRNGHHHNVLKTRCPQDHEYTPENTRWTTKPDGRRARRCVTCVRKQGREAEQRRRDRKRSSYSAIRLS